MKRWTNKDTFRVNDREMRNTTRFFCPFALIGLMDELEAEGFDTDNFEATTIENRKRLQLIFSGERKCPEWNTCVIRLKSKDKKPIRSGKQLLLNF